MASEGATSLADMITSLLDVHRLESGEMPMSILRADLRAIITAAAAPFASLLEAGLIVWFPPEEPAEVNCDVELIERVLTNLISNAVKFTPAKGEIRLTLAEYEGGSRVSVADTGVGIPAKDHARIFEKFGQVDGTQQRHSTGLGLTFCKLAIEAQGGAIGVKSVEGEGTTMWFSLPRA